MEKNKIITQAPIQVREDTLHKHERFLSLLTAEAINHINELLTGKDRKRIDIWNVYNSKQNRGYKSETERQKDITKLIDARYELLTREYHIESANRIILRDDAIDYQNIIKNTIRDLMNQGIFNVKKAVFHICKKCGYIVAPIEASITLCPMCNHNELGNIEKTGMFMNFDKNIITDFSMKNFNVLSKEGNNRVKTTMLTMPTTIQLSKNREFGLKLNEFGVDDDFVLDPKISVALAGKVIREMGLGEIDLMIQGFDTVKNNVPFSLLLDSISDTKFLTIGTVPSFSTSEIERYGSTFYFPFLSLLVASKNGKITEHELQQLQNEFIKTQKKLENCIIILNNLSMRYEEEINIPEFDNEIKLFLTEFNQMITDYRFKQALESLRSFIYDTLSRQYIKKCKLQKKKPNMSFFAYIQSILNSIYRSKY